MISRHTTATLTLIEGNSIHDASSQYGGAMHLDHVPAKVVRNRISQIDSGSAIRTQGDYAQTIANNFFSQIAYGLGTASAIEIAYPLTGWHHIYNNTFASLEQGIALTDSQTEVTNNIFTHVDISITNSGSSALLTGWNNLFFENGSNPNPLTNPVEQDPLLVDEAAGNLHILSNSPAVDSGLTLIINSEDIDGESRPQGSAFDIGADEFGGNFIFVPLFIR